MESPNTFGAPSNYGASWRLHNTARPPFDARWAVYRVGLPAPLIDLPAAVNSQRRSKWCWAACVAIVLAYYGHPVSQERIVFEIFGRLVDAEADLDQILYLLNGTWDDDNGYPFAVESGEGWAYVHEVISDLVYDCPLIVGTRGNPGHAMVLSDLFYARPRHRQPYGASPMRIVSAIVRDPAPGVGRRVLAAAEWRSIGFAAQVRVTSLA